jgi:hypothetical protein
MTSYCSSRARRIALRTVSALSLWFFAPHWDSKADEEIEVFSYGTGDGQVGYIESGDDAQDIGPAAIATDGDRFFILDRANLRVLGFDPKTKKVEQFSLADVLDPVDLQAAGKFLYVFDAASRSMSLVSETGKAPSAAQGSAEADNQLDHDSAAVSGFFHNGWKQGEQAVEGNAELDDSYIGAAEAASSAGPVQQVVTYEGVVILAKYVASVIGRETATNYRGELVFAPSSAAANARTLVIMRSAIVHSAKLLAVLSDGRSFVMLTESNSGAGNVNIRRIVIEYGPTGKATRQYNLLSPGRAEISGRSVVVGPDGRVVSLEVSKQSARLVSILGGPLSDISSGQDAPQVTVPIEGAPELNFPQKMTTALDILLEAGRAAQVEWKVPGASIQKESRCDPKRGGYWSRPSKLAKQDQEVLGLPYCWGCADTIDAFLDGLEKGKIAGNVCTRRDCAQCIQPGSTIGVDCSGFLSNVWSLEQRVTTSSLPNIADRLPNLDQLRPGDALNKAGSHVRLFVGRVRTQSGEQVIIYESSVSCGGVCMRNVDWGDLEGYVPYRRKNLGG